MKVIRFNNEMYFKDLAYNIILAVEELTSELNLRVIKNMAAIKLNILDYTEKQSVKGMESEINTFLYPMSLKQILLYGSRVIGGVKIAGGQKSITALFYEYGTGTKSKMPSGRWNHLSPNPLKKGTQIVGRKTEMTCPKGVKLSAWGGEEYPVIKGNHGYVLTHKTKGLKQGRPLPHLEVKAYFFMKNAVLSMREKIKESLLKAICSTNPKNYFTFKNIIVRR